MSSISWVAGEASPMMEADLDCVGVVCVQLGRSRFNVVEGVWTSGEGAWPGCMPARRHVRLQPGHRYRVRYLEKPGRAIVHALDLGAKPVALDREDVQPFARCAPLSSVLGVLAGLETMSYRKVVGETRSGIAGVVEVARLAMKHEANPRVFHFPISVQDREQV